MLTPSEIDRQRENMEERSEEIKEKKLNIKENFLFHVRVLSV